MWQGCRMKKKKKITSQRGKPGATEKNGLRNHSQVKEPQSKQEMFSTSRVEILTVVSSRISELRWTPPDAR